MLWSQLKVLLPTFFGYWVFVTVLAAGAWWGWTKIYSQYKFKWVAPLLISSAACAYMVGNTIVTYYQNSRLYAYQQKMQASTQPAKAQESKADSPLQMKAKFLKIVESLVSNPDQVTPDIKNKLFAQYGMLFQKPQDKMDYKNAISSVYQCQRIFWEDAMASYKSKKAIKSDERKQCETMSGAFFNREKLIPADTAKANDETVANMAAHKRVPASDGKKVEVSETMLRNILDAQIRAIEALNKIFD